MASRVDAILQAPQQVLHHLRSGRSREQVDGPVPVESHNRALKPPLRGILGTQDLRRERQMEGIAAARARLEAHGVPIGASVPVPGFDRFECRDPFGNRVEFIAPVE